MPLQKILAERRKRQRSNKEQKNMTEKQKNPLRQPADGGKMPSLMELLQAGVHFGHSTGRWHPKMEEFIYTERSGVHVIDLEKTLVKLQAAADFAKNTAKRGGVILFVGTKRQAQGILQKAAKETNMPYIKERWLGGLFTNFANVSKLIKKYNDLVSKRESGALEKYTKKEQVEFNKEIEKLDGLVGGLTKMTKIPDAIFVVDARKEKTAVTEASKKNVSIISFVDSNINPDMINYPIPANDDAIKSIEIIVGVIKEAILEGQEKKN